MLNEYEPVDDYRVTAISFLVKIFNEWLFIGLITGLCVLASEVYILHSQEKFTTTVLLGHVATVDNVPTSTSASALGGAIALIGIGPVSNDAKFNLFLTLTKTQAFAKELAQEENFKVPHGKTVLPNYGAVMAYLGQIAVTPVGDGTTTLTMQINDSEFARYFLMVVYKRGDDAVRNMDRERARKFASFIEERFRSEDNRAMQDSLGALLVNQERFLMLTSISNLPYSVQLLDGPTSTDVATSPKKQLLLMIGVAVGFGLSIFGILMWDAAALERSGRGLTTMGPSEFLRNSPRLAVQGLRRLTGRP